MTVFHIESQDVPGSPIHFMSGPKHPHFADENNPATCKRCLVMVERANKWKSRNESWLTMAEFLALSDDNKVAYLQERDTFETYKHQTKDLGTCSQCGKKADVGDFCFGCHELVCQQCIQKEPHYSACLALQ